MFKKSVKFVSRPWGFEKIVENNEFYCGKFLFCAKGEKSDLKYYKTKKQTFYLHSGKIEVRFSDEIEKLQKSLSSGSSFLYDILEKETLNQGDTFYIPPRRAHQIIFLEDSEIFEVSSFHDDLDIVRLFRL